jgi:hypothetical protein
VSSFKRDNGYFAAIWIVLLIQIFDITAFRIFVVPTFFYSYNVYIYYYHTNKTFINLTNESVAKVLSNKSCLMVRSFIRREFFQKGQWLILRRYGLFSFNTDI